MIISRGSRLGAAFCFVAAVSLFSLRADDDAVVTYRQLERGWQLLCRMAERSEKEAAPTVAVTWIPRGLSAAWLGQEIADRQGRPDLRRAIPKERVVKVLSPMQATLFLRGLSPIHARRRTVDSSSEREVGGGGVGSVAIAMIELKGDRSEVVELTLDPLGLHLAGGGSDRELFSPYLAEFLNDLAMSGPGVPLPPYVKDCVSGDHLARLSRAAYSADLFALDDRDE